MMYKCKKCGFKDVMMGIQAHLVYNKCGAGDDYDFKTSNIKDYATIITQQQFDKELRELSEKSIKERQIKKSKKEETEINKEGKKVTKKGKFEVEE